MLRGPLAVCVPLSFCLTVSGATLKLDPTVEFQTIDGFGGFGGKSVNWSPPIWDDNFGNLMINDWGLTISRQEYYPGDGKYDCDNDMIMDFNRRLKAVADAAGEPLKFMCTFWSPPGYWKNNGSATDGGNLNADRYDRHRASRAQRDHAVRPELHPPDRARRTESAHRRNTNFRHATGYRNRGLWYRRPQDEAGVTRKLRPYHSLSRRGHRLRTHTPGHRYRALTGLQIRQSDGRGG